MQRRPFIHLGLAGAVALFLIPCLISARGLVVRGGWVVKAGDA
jgi:hypothetical protein